MAALLRQVARRLSRLDLDVFFLGTAIGVYVWAQPSQYNSVSAEILELIQDRISIETSRQLWISSSQR